MCCMLSYLGHGCASSSLPTPRGPLPTKWGPPALRPQPPCYTITTSKASPSTCSWPRRPSTRMPTQTHAGSQAQPITARGAHKLTPVPPPPPSTARVTVLEYLAQSHTPQEGTLTPGRSLLRAQLEKHPGTGQHRAGDHTHTQKHTHIHSFSHTLTYAHTHTHIQIHTHTCTLIHIHTYTHILELNHTLTLIHT